MKLKQPIATLRPSEMTMAGACKKRTARKAAGKCKTRKCKTTKRKTTKRTATKAKPTRTNKLQMQIFQ